MKQKFKSVDEYIKSFPPELQEKLKSIRKTIIDNAPDVSEGISYGMPAYKTNKKPLVYFAGYDKHIGFYATPDGHEDFAKELSIYKQGKGSVQFSMDKPVPLDLIAKIVKFRLKGNQLKK